MDPGSEAAVQPESLLDPNGGWVEDMVAVLEGPFVVGLLDVVLGAADWAEEAAVGWAEEGPGGRVVLLQRAASELRRS